MNDRLFDPEAPPTGQVRAHRDPVAGTVARDAALDGLAERRPRDVDLCVTAIRTLTATRDTITGDDVWVELGDAAETITAPRVMGAAMRAAQKAGLIEPTQNFIPSSRPSRHRGPVRVWRRAA